MFRSVGSVVFGIAADRYGRKWPFIINNVLFIALELVREPRPESVLRGSLASLTLFLCEKNSPIPALFPLRPTDR